MTRIVLTGQSGTFLQKDERDFLGVPVLLPISKSVIVSLSIRGGCSGKLKLKKKNNKHGWLNTHFTSLATRVKTAFNVATWRHFREPVLLLLNAKIRLPFDP